MQVAIESDQLKSMLKDAVREALEEERGFLYELVADVLEDIGMSRAIDEGGSSGQAERNEVLAALDEVSG